MALIKCEECGKEISSNAKNCINCGNPIVNAVDKQSCKTKTNINPLVLSGFIMAIISLLLNFYGIVGIVATVLSVLGLNQILVTNENSKGLAIAGICIGSFSILYGVIQIITLAVL